MELKEEVITAIAVIVGKGKCSKRVFFVIYFWNTQRQATISQPHHRLFERYELFANVDNK